MARMGGRGRVYIQRIPLRLRILKSKQSACSKIKEMLSSQTYCKFDIAKYLLTVNRPSCHYQACSSSLLVAQFHFQDTRPFASPSFS